MTPSPAGNSTTDAVAGPTRAPQPPLQPRRGPSPLSLLASWCAPETSIGILIIEPTARIQLLYGCPVGSCHDPQGEDALHTWTVDDPGADARPAAPRVARR